MNYREDLEIKLQKVTLAMQEVERMYIKLNRRSKKLLAN